MPVLVVIGPQIKEKQREAQCAPPAYTFPKDPSLNRVKSFHLVYIDRSPTIMINRFPFGKML